LNAFISDYYELQIKVFLQSCAHVWNHSNNETQFQKFPDIAGLHCYEMAFKNIFTSYLAVL